MVYRDCNSAAHNLASWSLHQAYFDSFDSTFGPIALLMLLLERPESVLLM